MSKDKEKGAVGYKGPGRVLGTLGGFTAGGFISRIINIGVKPVYEDNKKLPVGIEGKWAWLRIIIGAVAAIGGAVMGYRKAKRGQEQFEQNNAELANMRSEVGIEQQKHQITKQEMELLEKRTAEGKGKGHAATQQERAVEQAQSALQIS